MDTDSSSALLDVWGTGAGNVFAVGWTNFILRLVPSN